ncbi:MAG: hypothetical protein A7315_15285 [Candidatus Altiarchaeales archaeon WOR_SM1_79]|nr:MAG: hypothetical protein A7315_15285 [Candidatus Altiarchaeales archaeon WOR_SM1_79]
MECLITYKFEEIEILSTIRLGIGRIIVVGDRPNVPSSKIFKNLGIEIEEKASKIKPGSKIGEIVHGVLDMISSAREKGNEPIILLPHDRRISIGMYIARGENKNRRSADIPVCCP